MKNIAIIGAGGLGARHLQAIAQIDISITIQVMDISTESLIKAKELYEQVPHENIKRIEFLTDLSALEQTFDIVIIATPSKPRFQIIKELLHTKKIEFLVLEKVLFPRLSEYDEIGTLLNEKNCTAWVNCPRRMWQSYIQLKKQINQQNIEFTLTGSNWGLGCNSIHYIDLIAYLTGSADSFECDHSNLDSGYIQSKRDGYIEFTGTLTGKSAKCTHFCLTSSKDDETPSTLVITSKNARIKIHEDLQKAYISHKETNWQHEEVTFDTPYQSQLSDKLVSDIIKTGTCQLTPYHESAKLQKAILGAFLLHLKKESGKDVHECMIT